MKYAIAISNIKPWEFWELTLAEFNVMMDAYLWNDYHERARLAMHARWVMSPHVKSSNIPTVEELIGKHPDDKEEEEKKPTTKDDLEDMKQRMGK